MGPDQTKQLSNLGQGPTYLQKFPPTPCQLRPMSNSMGPGQTKQLSSLIRVQTICKGSPQLPVELYTYLLVCFVFVNCLNMVFGFGVFVFSFLILVFQECGILCVKVRYFKKSPSGRL